MANNFPNIRPTLNLDMVNGIYVDPRVTFTRAGTRTYFSRDMVKAEENLLVQSQAFDNASWGNSASAIVRTANTGVAPDGSTTADSWKGDGTSALHYSGQLITLVSAPVSRLSIYAKADGVNFIQIFAVGGSGYANFDITAGAGVVGTAAAPFSDLTIQDAGGGWYRCTCLITSSAHNNIYIALSNSATAVRAAASFATSDGVFLWGAQLEQRSSVTAYTPTTTQQITNYNRLLKTAAANEWPREFDPVTGECLGRSVWEARTNLLLRSEDLSTTWTNEESSESVNVAIAPDGTLTADLLIPNTNNLSHWINQSVTTTAAVHTLSFFAKAGGYSVAQVLNSNSGTDFINFNLSTGLIGSSTSYTGTITSIGNGWYRCTATFTATAGLGGWARIGIVPASTSARGAAFAGNGYSGIYIWGAQLELGSFAATYIPTAAAQVTSVADSALITGTNFSQWYNQAEGALFMQSTPVTLDAGNGVTISDNTASNRIRLGSSTTEQGAVTVGGSAQAALDGGTPVINTLQSVAMSYKVNDFALSLGGGTVATDTVGTVPVVSQLAFATNEYIRRFTYYPQALTSANLQAVTA